MFSWGKVKRMAANSSRHQVVLQFFPTSINGSFIVNVEFIVGKQQWNVRNEIIHFKSYLDFFLLTFFIVEKKSRKESTLLSTWTAS